MRAAACWPARATVHALTTGAKSTHVTRIPKRVRNPDSRSSARCAHTLSHSLCSCSCWTHTQCCQKLPRRRPAPRHHADNNIEDALPRRRDQRPARIDVSNKTTTTRKAIARCRVVFPRDAWDTLTASGFAGKGPGPGDRRGGVQARNEPVHSSLLPPRRAQSRRPSRSIAGSDVRGDAHRRASRWAVWSFNRGVGCLRHDHVLSHPSLCQDRISRKDGGYKLLLKT